ncbi:MAG TPA: RNA polymerase sigma factor, partial [candidate division Zixibacteria bacterium]|nr:RNA polymerase sigma factor [candidate division Zixibacteria bacterium]
TTNYAIDLIRWKQKRFISIDSGPGTPGSVRLELTDKADKPDQILENRELIDRIKRAIKKLPPRQRVTVILHDLEGFSKREVAGILQCPQATVRSNLHIARTKLRKWLQENNKGR